MEKKGWYGLGVNFKWPHDGFVLGISWDFFEWDEDSPWASFIFRIAFLTIMYDVGYGDDDKEIYTNRFDV
tara:strand:- start:184 stop:393 length:210 start_codon:yes stop_codon:yes gene_type:complete